MIVYGDRSREVSLDEALGDVRLAAGRLAGAAEPDHAGAVELLVALAELEAAVEDALAPVEDAFAPEAEPLRQATRAAGRLLHATWRGEAAAPLLRGRACAAAEALAGSGLPARVTMRVPEGFAWYALLPECHLEAAARVARERRPSRALCVGLRSIGTALAAVVAGALEAHGCAVELATLRPRGHPFERTFALSSGARRQLRQAVADGRLVLLVDEGPGLSGSSLAAAAALFDELGARDEQIVLLPAHEPDPERLASPSARERWRRHACVVEPFDEVWLASGRLAAAFDAGGLVDLSGGLWRRLAYGGEQQHPAVHAGHERRKYLRLARRKEYALGPSLLKFEGLGRRGRAARARAQRLHGAGFGPRPGRLCHGFLETEWLAGRPLEPADYAPRVRDRIAAYVTALARMESAPGPAPTGSLAEMVRVNVEEAIGPAAAARLSALVRDERHLRDGVTIAVDGRMLPHEFVDCGGRLVKTDALGHHDDHFFPGRQDAAWDVAGAAVEFALDAAAEADLASACAASLGDPDLVARLPGYRAAYLSYRLGYATLGATSLAGTSEAGRFDALRRRYCDALVAMLRGEPAQARAVRAGGR